MPNETSERYTIGLEGPETSNQNHSSNNRTNFKQSSISLNTIAVNDQYDVLDSSGRWCEAQICKIDTNTRRVFVTYLYWDNRFDEWIGNISERIAPLHTNTYVEGGVLKKGQRLEVQDEYKKWIEAFVIDEKEDRVKIHYKGYHEKFDEWILRNSNRFRPYGREKEIVKKRDFKRFKVPGSLKTTQYAQFPTDDDKENMVQKLDSDGLLINEPINPSLETLETSEFERTRRIPEISEQFLRYKNALAEHNLRVVSILGDGNCLFRAVAHQVYGDQSLHYIVREKCVEYMESESDFFSQFVEGGKESFPFYLAAKRMDACWGDDPEIEAICEMYNRPAEIWAFDPIEGARKLRTFHESSGLIGQNSLSSARLHSSDSLGKGRSSPVMRLSYYGGGHYDSIIPIHNSSQDSFQPHLLAFKPGEVENLSILRSKERGLNSVRVGETEARRISDEDATYQTTLDLAIKESRDFHMNTAYDDLETCLMLSMQPESEKKGENIRSLKEEGVLAFKDGKSSKDLGENDLIAIQGNLLKSVREESEREYLEKALVSSLTDDANVAEEDLLEEAKKKSEQDLLETQLSAAAGESDLELALKLSELSEEEALAFAINESRNSNTSSAIKATQLSGSSSNYRGEKGDINSWPHTTATAQYNGDLIQSEDELFQLALAASMNNSNSPINCNYTGDNNGSNRQSYHRGTNVINDSSGSGFLSNNMGNNTGINEFVNMEEMDEDLIRAIQESLKN